MKSNINIGITDDLKKQIIEIVTNYKPINKLIIFGSRSRVDYKKTSDIDLAIYDKNWTSTDINIVKDRLEEEIPTVLKFDLLSFSRIEKKSLREEIEKGVIIYDSSAN